MADFAMKGDLGGANGMAALAVVRALLKHMQKKGALIPKDIAEIVIDATAQMRDQHTTRADEARRLVQQLTEN